MRNDPLWQEGRKELREIVKVLDIEQGKQRCLKETII